MRDWNHPGAGQYDYLVLRVRRESSPFAGLEHNQVFIPHTSYPCQKREQPVCGIGTRQVVDWPVESAPSEERAARLRDWNAPYSRAIVSVLVVRRESSPFAGLERHADHLGERPECPRQKREQPVCGIGTGMLSTSPRQYSCQKREQPVCGIGT